MSYELTWCVFGLTYFWLHIVVILLSTLRQVFSGPEIFVFSTQAQPVSARNIDRLGVTKLNRLAAINPN